MRQFSEEWRAHQRARWLRPDAHRWVRPDAHRWVRPDAHRWFRGNSPAAVYGWTDKANFNPNQPRVPAGNPDGGQWTDGGGGGSGPQTAEDAPPDVPLRITIRPSGIGDDSRPPLEPPPPVPQERPRTRQLENRIARAAAQWLLRAALRGATGPAGNLLNAIEVAIWLHEHLPNMQSYFDPPKSLGELRDAVTTPKRGYDLHHIVEQGPAERDGFPRALIDAPDNLVRIARYRHWQINAWYGRPNKDFGGLSPRDYLRGIDWEERRRIGLDTLIEFGVLEP
jgi:hypothetical protein